MVFTAHNFFSIDFFFFQRRYSPNWALTSLSLHLQTSLPLSQYLIPRISSVSVRSHIIQPSCWIIVFNHSRSFFPLASGASWPIHYSLGTLPSVILPHVRPIGAFESVQISQYQVPFLQYLGPQDRLQMLRLFTYTECVCNSLRMWSTVRFVICNM